ncbi:hypothetical protein GDO78_016910 [Eleutherodactylus coqui]|nr:hypothetical protein GDO78_016910 [Eleutherodactylus coqui]
MPVGYKEKELPEDLAHNLQWDIIEGNFFSATLADIHKLDVLDMHYHFRCDLRLRCRDAIHWNQLAHRKYTQILLTHIARAWGVEPPKGNTTEGSSVPTALPQSVALRKDPKLRPTLKKRASCHQGKIPLLPTPNGVVMGSQPTGQRMMSAESTVLEQLLQLFAPSSVSAGAEYMPGYTSFDGRDVNAMPGVPCLDYTNDMFLHLDGEYRRRLQHHAVFAILSPPPSCANPLPSPRLPFSSLPSDYQCWHAYQWFSVAPYIILLFHLSGANDVCPMKPLRLLSGMRNQRHLRLQPSHGQIGIHQRTPVLAGPPLAPRSLR